MNRTNKILLISDVFVLTGFGLIDPILAIYIKDNIVGGTIFAAGLASMLFFITKCLVQLPFAKYVDNHEDKVKWLVLGAFLIANVPFIYLYAKNVNYVYFAQVLYGLGCGLAYPTWYGLWSVNLTKNKESYEWSIHSVFTGIGVALTAAIGSAIAEFVGFTYTFVLVGVMSLAGCCILFFLEARQERIEKEKRRINKK
ncbi:MAG: MFS transporter [Candidatus Woesearchaeota archaeon]